MLSSKFQQCGADPSQKGRIESRRRHHNSHSEALGLIRGDHSFRNSVVIDRTHGPEGFVPGDPSRIGRPYHARTRRARQTLSKGALARPKTFRSVGHRGVPCTSPIGDGGLY